MAAGQQEMQDADEALPRRIAAADVEFEERAFSRSSSSSSSSSSSQIDDDSLFPIFRSAKKRAVPSSSDLPVAGAVVLPDSSSSSLSSSASSASAAAAVIEWVDPSSESRFSSDVWKLHVFFRSKTKDKVTNNYKLKCKFCDWHMDYHGTTDMQYHAEHKHPTLPAVAAWVKAKNAAAEVKAAQAVSSRQSLINVCLLLYFSVPLSLLIISVITVGAKVFWYRQLSS